MLILLGLGSLATAKAREVASGCLCTYGEPCWPDASTFSQLQSQVSQSLVYPFPSASACYPPSDPSGNCTAAIVNWGDGNWCSSLPGAMKMTNWETFVFRNGTVDVCYLNTNITGTCGQGGVPVIGVDARSVSDIQAAVNFAVELQLKLVVKNTGHDLAGRSTARGSFVVWTHNMKDITYNLTFVPQGGPRNTTYKVVTLGAGVQWHEAYAAINKHQRIMVGTLAPGGSVGSSGGWLAGGGHSALSPNYGLGVKLTFPESVDNVLEICVVLSTGEYLTTNDHHNSRLFWALRGGGGGTYGIVTSVTYRTYPSVPAQLYSFQANVTNSSAVLQELVGEFLRYQPQFTDDGWGGYGLISPTQMSFSYIAPNMTNETAAATIQGWANYTRSLEPFCVLSANQLQCFSTWYDLYQLLFGSGTTAGANFMMSNRLLSRDTLSSNSSQIARVLIDCQAMFNTIAGGKVNRIDPDSAGLNPAWRKAVIEPACTIVWNDGELLTEINTQIDQFPGWIKRMYDLSPNDGTYLNEASLFEIDWQKVFFGSHYSTLKEIKDKYDPHRLFVIADGVGSEDWNEILTCRY